jgi:hypothetical protein
MKWVIARDGDGWAYAMYRRHYPAAKNPRPRQRQFVGPGQKMVLVGFMANALFVWRKFKNRSGQHGVNCAVFRNESPLLSSDLIREAMVWAWERWPGERLYTYVNPRRVRSTNPGYCFLRAGWRRCGRSKGRLLVLEALP